MTAASAGGAVAIAAAPQRRGRPGWGLALFLLPAAILLGALVAYPIVFTIIRSLFDRSGDAFVGLGNYQRVFTNGRTLIALRNNVIWVVVAPSVVTALGLIFAVLSERVRWQTAFKIVVFMPMAISFLAAGVIFRLVYEHSPDRGLANAVITTVSDPFREPAPYPGARVREADGATSNFAMVGLPPAQVPDGALPARPTARRPSALAGTVWLDFSRGGGGEPGVIDESELGLPGMEMEAVSSSGEVLGRAETGPDGRYVIAGVDDASIAQVRLAASNFREPFAGVRWLGPALVTPAVIGAYVWIWAGFAMVVISAGLAAISREVLEAARVDGATEWQVFRRVTVPLLAPVLLVVLVTLVINVLKVFDLVLIIPPGSVQDDANVLALEMWRVSFGGARDQGLGSALGVFLLLLVMPAMAFNIRRFRQDAAQ